MVNQCGCLYLWYFVANSCSLGIFFRILYIRYIFFFYPPIGFWRQCKQKAQSQTHTQAHHPQHRSRSTWWGNLFWQYAQPVAFFARVFYHRLNKEAMRDKRMACCCHQRDFFSSIMRPQIVGRMPIDLLSKQCRLCQRICWWHAHPFYCFFFSVAPFPRAVCWTLCELKYKYLRMCAYVIYGRMMRKKRSSARDSND